MRWVMVRSGSTTWRCDAKTDTDVAIVDETYESTGAVVIGKRMFEVGFEPWGDPPPFGTPVFIVTHEARKLLPMQAGTTCTFVTAGIEAALETARAAAGLRGSHPEWIELRRARSIETPGATRFRFEGVNDAAAPRSLTP
jgi:dihydrofolate reductase